MNFLQGLPFTLPSMNMFYIQIKISASSDSSLMAACVKLGKMAFRIAF